MKIFTEETAKLLNIVEQGARASMKQSAFLLNQRKVL